MYPLLDELASTSQLFDKERERKKKGILTEVIVFTTSRSPTVPLSCKIE